MCGDPDGMLNSIRNARGYRRGLSTAGDGFIDDGSESDDDSSSATGSESSSSSGSSSGSDDFDTPRDGGENVAAEQPSRAAAGDGKRYEGTDEERAERLARMMAAQCTMEAPEKVGLRTGWKPSSSGFGVVPDSTNAGSFGTWSPQASDTSAVSSTKALAAAASSVTAPVGVTTPARGFNFAFSPASSSRIAHGTNASDSHDEIDVRAMILGAHRAYVAVRLTHRCNSCRRRRPRRLRRCCCC